MTTLCQLRWNGPVQIKPEGKSVALPTCHVAMLQEPEKVADLITEATREAVKK